MSQHTIVVPDIGDYTDVPVIEILVKPGDEITKEQALLVLESDKATMEVPADQAGKVISVSSICAITDPFVTLSPIFTLTLMTLPA